MIRKKAKMVWFEALAAFRKSEQSHPRGLFDTAISVIEVALEEAWIEVSLLRAVNRERAKVWWTSKDRAERAEAEVDALRMDREIIVEANCDLQRSAQFCPSCGRLLPEHAEWCGRAELVISELLAERDALKARVEKLEAIIEDSLTSKKGKP